MSQAHNNHTEQSDTAHQDQQPDPAESALRRNDTDQAVVGSPARQFSLMSTAGSIPSSGERGNEMIQAGQWGEDETQLTDSPPQSATGERDQLQQQQMLSMSMTAYNSSNFGASHLANDQSTRSSTMMSRGDDTNMSRGEVIPNGGSYGTQQQARERPIIHQRRRNDGHRGRNGGGSAGNNQMNGVHRRS